MLRSNKRPMSQETLTRSSINGSQLDLTIDYDIVLSPTYQVPVLYFVFPSVPHVGTTGLDAIYQYLVPRPYASPLKKSGVMGGISFGVCHRPQS
jgi:ubiquitin-like-conjugating enzyme ATG10